MDDFRFIYLIAVGLSLVELVIYYEMSAKNANKNYIILFLSTVLSNFGTAFANFAPNLESCMCGTMISYMGSIFIMTFMLVLVFELCQRKFPLWARIPLFIIAFFFIIMVCSTQETGLFFRDLTIYQIHGLTILQHTNGPVLPYYIIFLAVVDIAAIVVVLDTIRIKKQVSQKTLYELLGMLIFGTVFYAVLVLSGVRYNVMVFDYIIMQAIFISLSLHATMYDIPSNLMSVYKTRGGYGYIAFDLNKRFLGCDELAVNLFPCLKDVPIDSHLKDNCSEVIEKLNYEEIKWTWEEMIGEDFTISVKGASAICTIHKIKNNNKDIGYLFELRDNTSQQNYINGIKVDNQVLSLSVAEKTEKLSAMQESIIRGMAMMVESRDNSTGGHILRTSDCVRIFANRIRSYPGYESYSQTFWDDLIKAAPMHDLGKIAVDDAILRKPGKFEPGEYEMMKTHSTKGAVIVQEVLKETTDLEFKQIATNVAHYHHEKWNGEGYPSGIKGEDIPFEARIMALVDVFDALVSRRCYKDAKSFDEAFSIIENDLGKHFDYNLGKIFLECRPQLEEYYSKALSAE